MVAEEYFSDNPDSILKFKELFVLRGLYAVMITTLVYSLVGNSRQLGVGPVAMVSLIVESGLKGVVNETECPALLNNPDKLPSYELPGTIFKKIESQAFKRAVQC